MAPPVSDPLKMAKLKDPRPNAAVRFILPDAIATVVTVESFGSGARELTGNASMVDPSPHGDSVGAGR